MLPRLAVALWFVFGCEGSLPAATNAGNVAGAVTRSLNGGPCLAQCAYGTQCDERTGLCEHIPCGGACEANLVCEVTAKGEECIPASLSVDRSKRGQ